MDENQFSIGDLVAHKHYPEKAIGTIIKIHASGRVGVSGDRARSFLPKNLVLVVEQISPVSDAIATKSEVMEILPREVEELGEAIATTPNEDIASSSVIEAEELTEHPVTCSKCGSQDIRCFHYHNPNEYWFYCRNCDNEGWRSEKLPPAQVEVEEWEVEELGDAMPSAGFAYATDEVMEVVPLEVEELSAKKFLCPKCGSDDLSIISEANFSENWEDRISNPCLVCNDCDQEWDKNDPFFCQLVAHNKKISNPSAPSFPTPPKPPTPPLPPAQAEKLADAIATESKVMELLPVPRDFSELDQMPQWWERPVLPDFHESICGDRYDDDEDLDWVQETYGVDATYRNWKLTINDGYEIYATPPEGDRLYHCECELDVDGPCGQVAIAQEFIDCWYFAQPSPGQLSLNFDITVARAPPPLPAAMMA